MSESKRYLSGWGNVRTSYALIDGTHWEIARLNPRRTYVIWIDDFNGTEKRIEVPWDQLESIVNLLRSGSAL